MTESSDHHTRCPGTPCRCPSLWADDAVVSASRAVLWAQISSVCSLIAVAILIIW